MNSRTAEFLRLIDRSLDLAERMSAEQPSDRLNQALQRLRTLRQEVATGQLEPSGGTTTLGLARELADWIDLDSPLLEAVGEIERYYQQ